MKLKWQSRRSATSDLLTWLQYCSFRDLSPWKLLSSLLRDYAWLFISCVLNVCQPPAILDYATTCTTCQKPGREKSDMLTVACAKSMVFTDHKELALICFSPSYKFNTIYLNPSTLSWSHPFNSAQASVSNENLLWHWSFWPSQPLMLHTQWSGLVFKSHQFMKACVEGGKQISVVTSVLHDGTQQDFSSRPAVTILSEMKRSNTKGELVEEQGNSCKERETENWGDRANYLYIARRMEIL